MFTRMFTLLVIVLALHGGSALAGDRPKVAFISLGPDQSSTLTAIGMMHSLADYGFVGENDPPAYALVEKDYAGEELAINWYDANFDLPTANVIVETAIDTGADILVAVSPAIAQIAVNITSDMGTPIPVFFAVVENPFLLGIAASPCIKPAHVSGTLAPVPYAEIVSLLQAQNPQIETIGAIYALGDGLGEANAQQLTEAAEAQGVTVLTELAVSTADVRAAAAALIADGVEAFVQPADSFSLQGLPILSAAVEGIGIPVYHTDPTGIFWGATVSAGFFRWYDQGRAIGAMVARYLNHELDVSRTAIIQRSSPVLYGVNHGAAASAAVALTAEVLDNADFALTAEGEIVMNSREAAMEFARVNALHGGDDLPNLEAQRAADAELFASLECSDERIAAEQAELEA